MGIRVTRNTGSNAGPLHSLPPLFKRKNMGRSGPRKEVSDLRRQIVLNAVKEVMASGQKFNTETAFRRAVVDVASKNFNGPGRGFSTDFVRDVILKKK